MAKKKEVKQPADEKLGSDPFLVEIGRRIKKIRIDSGITQEDLGIAAGRVSPAYIYLAERGRQNMTLAVFRRIADALKVPIEDLLSDAELQTAPTDRSLQHVGHVIEKLNAIMIARSEEDAAIKKEIEKVTASHEEMVRILKKGDKTKPTR